MELVTIKLKNKKAKQLLNDLAELDLIEIKNTKNTVSKLRITPSHLKNLISHKMSEKEIDKQLKSIRKEWQRDI
ncbi:MAG: hypothetical protein JST94_06605 [Bacteroidetes bacterium]|nr:hypothetical protein [Bacteroidota bacterium]MBS1642960.1 hypothetical protein [Bacteroidota bacterium]MBS1671107.1 hypothetical protein [Bacteroidota bacterium]